MHECEVGWGEGVPGSVRLPDRHVCPVNGPNKRFGVAFAGLRRGVGGGRRGGLCTSPVSSARRGCAREVLRTQPGRGRRRRVRAKPKNPNRSPARTFERRPARVARALRPPYRTSNRHYGRLIEHPTSHVGPSGLEPAGSAAGHVPPCPVPCSRRYLLSAPSGTDPRTPRTVRLAHPEVSRVGEHAL